MEQNEVLAILHNVVAENQQYTTWTVSTPHLVALVNKAIEKERSDAAKYYLDVLRGALKAEPPPEAASQAEKTAFAFGWFKGVEQLGQGEIAKRAAQKEHNAMMEFIDEFRGAESHRNAMFSEGYDLALEHMAGLIKGRS